MIRANKRKLKFKENSRYNTQRGVCPSAQTQLHKWPMAGRHLVTWQEWLKKKKKKLKFPEKTFSSRRAKNSMHTHAHTHSSQSRLEGRLCCHGDPSHHAALAGCQTDFHSLSLPTILPRSCCSALWDVRSNLFHRVCVCVCVRSNCSPFVVSVLHWDHTHSSTVQVSYGPPTCRDHTPVCLSCWPQ